MFFEYFPLSSGCDWGPVGQIDLHRFRSKGKLAATVNVKHKSEFLFLKKKKRNFARGKRPETFWCRILDLHFDDEKRKVDRQSWSEDLPCLTWARITSPHLIGRTPADSIGNDLWAACILIYSND